jgi:hypothetical protein
MQQRHHPHAPLGLHPMCDRPTTTHLKTYPGCFVAASPRKVTKNNLLEDRTPTDYYYTASSFEATLNQVLELERNSPSSTSQSLEKCVRDFFRV